MPQFVMKHAMMAYILALLACNAAYAPYTLQIQWWIFGIIEVCGFFYLGYTLIKSWMGLKPKVFVRNVFLLSFFLRVVWVLLSYGLYQSWTGTPFSIGAADELVYDASANEIAQGMRNGNWNLLGLAQFSMGAKSGISDLGYPIYLGIIYYVFFDSILIARIIKAALGAWTAVLIYKLATRNFGEYTGRMAGIFCMLMPNLIYYCSFQLKEVEMVFLAMLFAERADYLLRQKKIAWKSLILLMLIPAYMFMIRTALAAVLVLAFLCALVLSSEQIIKWGRRTVLILIAVTFIVTMFFSSTNIGQDVMDMWSVGGSNQQANMEWRSEREGTSGVNQSFASYAGAAAFAPMIFTIPFPTMNHIEGQENQMMIHGGNFVKNIVSYFTLTALIILLFSGKWRKHVLIGAILCGYLVVLVFSNFAQSERFHQPVLPFILMFAAYGISLMSQQKLLKKWYNYWCIIMFVAALAWNWFKLAGRGLI
jgi:4-amino-4-deoxy-L-arabinose transferase-like glycosyltransferase